MAEQERRSHDEIMGDDVEAEITGAGKGSAVYHESDVKTLRNERDARTKTVLVSRDLVPDAEELLVDVVTYGPNVEIPRHYHEDSKHFFYVLEGSGYVEIEGEEFAVDAGSIIWVGEGDVHKVYTSDDQRMKILEYFSNNDHTATRVEGEGHTWTAE